MSPNGVTTLAEPVPSVQLRNATVRGDRPAYSYDTRSDFGPMESKAFVRSTRHMCSCVPLSLASSTMPLRMLNASGQDRPGRKPN